LRPGIDCDDIVAGSLLEPMTSLFDTEQPIFQRGEGVHDERMSWRLRGLKTKGRYRGHLLGSRRRKLDGGVHKRTLCTDSGSLIAERISFSCLFARGVVCSRVSGLLGLAVATRRPLACSWDWQVKRLHRADSSICTSLPCTLPNFVCTPPILSNAWRRYPLQEHQEVSVHCAPMQLLRKGQQLAVARRPAHFARCRGVMQH